MERGSSISGRGKRRGKRQDSPTWATTDESDMIERSVAWDASEEHDETRECSPSAGAAIWLADSLPPPRGPTGVPCVCTLQCHSDALHAYLGAPCQGWHRDCRGDSTRSRLPSSQRLASDSRISGVVGPALPQQDSRTCTTEDSIIRAGKHRDVMRSAWGPDWCLRCTWRCSVARTPVPSRPHFLSISES